MIVLLFYRCRFCLEAFSERIDTDHNPQRLLTGELESTHPRHAFTFHSCANGEEKSRTGIADLIGARYE